MDVLRCHIHENPVSGAKVHGVQAAGGQDGFELKTGYIHYQIGKYPLIADPGNMALEEVGRAAFWRIVIESDVLGAKGDAGMPFFGGGYLE